MLKERNLFALQLITIIKTQLTRQQEMILSTTRDDFVNNKRRPSRALQWGGDQREEVVRGDRVSPPGEEEEELCI